MSETKALKRILNWKLGTLMNVAFPIIIREDFESASAELDALLAENALLRKQRDEAIDALKTIIRTGRINGHISFANAIEVTYSDLLNQMKKGE